MNPRTFNHLSLLSSILSLMSLSKISVSLTVPTTDLKTPSIGMAKRFQSGTMMDKNPVRIFENMWINSDFTIPTDQQFTECVEALTKGIQHFEGPEKDKKFRQLKLPGLDRADGEPVWCENGYSVRLGTFDLIGTYNSTYSDGPPERLGLDIVRAALDWINYVGAKNPGKQERTWNRYQLSMSLKSGSWHIPGSDSNGPRCNDFENFQTIGFTWISSDANWGVTINKEKCADWGPYDACPYQGNWPNVVHNGTVPFLNGLPA